jgi:predicted nucleic acid-binding protein
VAYLVVDTDVASLMWRDALPGRFDRRLLGHTPVVTFVTIGEAIEGAYRGGWSRQRLTGLREFYAHTFGLVRWDDAIPDCYGRLMGLAATAGRIMGDNDCWIAACCVTHDLPLLTRNRKHFEPLEPLGLDLL